MISAVTRFFRNFAFGTRAAAGLAVFFLVAVLFSGCASVSLPSIPWFGSSLPPNPDADALFADGMNHFDNKRYATAIDRFQRLKSEYPFAPQLTETELKIADAFYLNKQYPEAIAAFKEFQAIHPTNEHIPFVVYRLGLAHFDQFTAIDRDQKMTEIAKGYFETVIKNHPKSSYAKQAREKLADCIEYLAEHDFNVALFYLREEKYPAARDRLEEIVRRYRGTPTAIRSLYFLGEAYRREKNSVKAALAYEALIQHYPESKFAQDAKTQLAQLDKERHDPLAMLLMRDRRPGYMAAPEATQETAVADGDKLKGLNLIAKKEVVHEEPGEDKGFFGRMADTLNPFSSPSPRKVEKKNPEPTKTVAAKKTETPKKESDGFFASFWKGLNPFSGSEESRKVASANNSGAGLVNQIDDSLKEKGVEPATQQAAFTPPQSSLPKVEEAPKPPTVDTTKLLGEIDSNLKKDGKSVAGLPPAPEAAAVLNTPRAEVEAAERAAAKPQPQSPPVTNSGLLSSIDQKLKGQGIEPPKVELPPPPTEVKKTAPKKPQPEKVELEPKIAVEKGPLYLGTEELPESKEQAKTGTEREAEKQMKEGSGKEQAPGVRELPQSVVKGPPQPQPVKPPPAKTTQTKNPTLDDIEDKGVFDQLREDAERIGNILNPFKW